MATNFAGEDSSGKRGRMTGGSQIWMSSGVHLLFWSKNRELLEIDSFFLPISIWRVGKKKVLGRKDWKLLKMLSRDASEVFLECVGRLVHALRGLGIISFTSIANPDVQYVNFQFYAYAANTITVPQLLGRTWPAAGSGLGRGSSGHATQAGQSMPAAVPRHARVHCRE